MGMTPNEHEYKLMGMAPYAPPAGAEACFRRFSGLLVFDGASGMVWRRAPGVPHTYYSHRFFERLIERQRFDCIAAGLQKFTEEHLVRWARNAMAATGVRRLALAGGVFMNVIANKRILELDEVEGLFIFPSCGDETNAVGAAFQVYAAARKRLGEAADVPPLGPIYWGPAPGEPDPGRLAALRRKGYGIAEPDDVEARVAELLAEGEVVARARGPMEFGARALGNRSILADPTHSDLVRRVNDMVKKRDFWMPFAPAILAERSHEYVRNPKGAEAPYMVLAFDTTEKVVDFPAAVQPYDRTARPQFVRRDDNPDFHRLLSCFARRTGRAVLLNTSFNLHGEPIVSSAADALDVLESSGLEHLALGPLLIHKPVRV
jgi:carbamoyltransferase